MIKHALPAALSLLISWSSALPAADFRVEGKSFLLDGKPFQIRSGEIHYSRVPRAEWASRIEMAKAMGLNTICTYVFWNYHETRRGEVDFEGEKDFIAFIINYKRQKSSSFCLIPFVKHFSVIDFEDLANVEGACHFPAVSVSLQGAEHAGGSQFVGKTTPANDTTTYRAM